MITNCLLIFSCHPFWRSKMMSSWLRFFIWSVLSRLALVTWSNWLLFLCLRAFVISIRPVSILRERVDRRRLILHIYIWLILPYSLKIDIHFVITVNRIVVAEFWRRVFIGIHLLGGGHFGVAKSLYIRFRFLEILLVIIVIIIITVIYLSILLLHNLVLLSLVLGLLSHLLVVSLLLLLLQLPPIL